MFTGFEPSGDDHAAAVIAELKRRDPSLEICAWGGPKMAAAGARIIERTGDDAVVGVPGIEKIREHRRMNKRIGAWIESNRPRVHVPVDSPAANFPVCALAKGAGAKVVHLVAPQVWAWGGWRVNKLRRLTDHVCCLLPFEEPWFRQRHVPATFVGHPLFDHELELGSLDVAIEGWPDAGGPRIAMMPGSRPAEITRNLPILLETYREIHRRHTGTVGIIAGTREDAEANFRRVATKAGVGWPDDIRVVHGSTDAVIRWTELALVVSGTVTLQIARQARPMVIVYKSSRLLYNVLGRWIIQTPFFTLPNLLAGRELVPELVPHFGGAEAMIERSLPLVRTEAAEQQRRSLADIAHRFRGFRAAHGAADIIELAVKNELPSLRTSTKAALAGSAAG